MIRRTTLLSAAPLVLALQPAASAQRIPVTTPQNPRPDVRFVHPLSSATPLWADGTRGPVEVDQSVGGAAANDGSTLRIGTRTFTTGFGTRASSVIAFDLEAEAVFFHSWVGIDEAVGNTGSARFQVIGDDVVLFDSGLVTGADQAVSTGRLDVRGVRELLLVALDGDNSFTNDHADWGDPVIFGRQAPDGLGARLRGKRGSWGPALPWPVQAMHASLLPSGHIVSHASAFATTAGNANPAAPHESTRVDRATVGTWAHLTIDHPTEELIGAGHARLGDGTLVELGGFGGRVGGAATGQDQASRYGDGQNAWLPMAPMAQPRFGATGVTLGDGSVLAIGGSNGGGANSFRPERYDGTAWSVLDGIDVSPWNAVGDASLDATFPAAHLTQDGQVLWTGWDERMALLDLTGEGSVSFVATRESTQRAWGTSTQMGPGLVTLVGGVDHRGAPGDALRSALLVVTGSGTPSTVPAAAPLFRRADHDATILADGTLFVNGGGARHLTGTNPTSIETPELYDARTNSWSLLAGAPVDRGYRSTALLLPDATVWVGGGDNRSDAHVFSPPYLFDEATGQPAARPVIASAPARIAYGASFDVTMATGAAVSAMTLVRAGSSTHGVNTDQRFLELSTSQSGATVTCTAPPRGYDAPPGDYMLFAMDADGTPSLARWVHIGPPRPSLWQFAFSSDSSIPEPRHETAMVEVSGKTYLIGGRGLKQTQEYDPVRRTWRDLGPPPFEIHHFQPVVVDGKVHAVGAFTGFYPNETNVANVWTFDPLTTNWTMGPAVPAGRRRGGAGAAVYDGKIYLVGGNNQGHNGGARPWFDEYDPATGTWTTLPDAPRARDHFLAVVVGHRLIVAGGRATTQPNPFVGTIAEVDVYDFTTGTWSTPNANIPTQRAGTMAVPVGRYAVIAGGESAGQVAAHDEVEAFDAIAERWTTLPDLQVGRHSGGIALLDGVAHIASGSGNQGGTPELPTMEILDLRALLAANPTSGGVTNAGFDEGFDGWSTTGTAVLSEWAGAAAPSARVAAGTLSTTVPASPGVSYRVRALYRVTGGGGVATLTAQFLDGGGSVLAQPQLALPNTLQPRLADLAATAPGGTVSVRIRVETTGARQATVDDVTLVLP